MRVYVSGGAEAGRALEVRGDAAHHLAAVVRVRAGEVVGVFDGQGHEWRGRVTAVDRRRVVIEAIEAGTPVAEPPVTITLAVGVLKGDQMDTVVRDATAMGVAVISPMLTDHVTVPSRAWQSGAARDRWTRVAIASAQQCGRAVVPSVTEVRPLDAVLSDAATVRLACLEPAAASTAWAGAPTEAPPSACVLIGPEGGWSPAEVQRFRESGVLALSLGPRTLRAELAPVVALAQLWERWGGAAGGAPGLQPRGHRRD